MGLPELRLAKTAAREQGVSLSAYVTEAVRRQLEERDRLEAARAIIAEFTPAELASPAEQQDLLALWARAPAKKRAARRRASKRRA